MRETKIVKIEILVLSQSSLEIYKWTLAMQKLATLFHIIQMLDQGIFYTYIAFDYWTLLPFLKIMQSFILMQNTLDKGMEETFWDSFSKKCPFWPISDAALKCSISDVNFVQVLVTILAPNMAVWNFNINM